MNWLLIALILFVSDVQTETHSSISVTRPQVVQPLNGELKTTVSPETITLRVGKKTYDLKSGLDYLSKIASHDELQRWLDGSFDDRKLDVADVCVEQVVTVEFTPGDSKGMRKVVIEVKLTGPASTLGVLKEVLEAGVEKAKDDARRVLTEQDSAKEKRDD